MVDKSNFNTKSINIGGADGQQSISQPNDRQVNEAVFGHARPAVQFMYSVAIWDTKLGSIEKLVGSPLDPKHQILASEYFFTVPPKVHEMSEPYTTQIVPTQNGGKFVESHGSIIREIKVSGTTGLRPNKLTRDAVPALKSIPIFGDAISGAVDNVASLGDNPLKPRGLANDNERTGYDDIIFLRNIFRHYSDLKASSSSGRYIMLWRNIKDADYWVVEPADFRLMQDSGSPMTYKYSITLRTLSRFDFTFDLPEDSFSIEQKIERLGRRLREFDRVLKSSLSTVDRQIDRVEGYGSFLQRAILQPGITVLQGVASIKNNVNTFGDNIEASGAQLNQNLDEALFLLGGPPPTGTGDPPPPIAENQREPLSAQDGVVNALRRMKLAVAALLSEPTIRTSPTSNAKEKVSRSAGAYRIDSGARLTSSPPANGGSSTALSNVFLSDNFRIAKVQRGDTIKVLALRLLGDSGRWKELALLNNLKAPFISDVGGVDVLAPGDDILYPFEGGEGPGAEIVNISTVKEDEALSVAEQAFGRDIRLRSSREGETQLTDFTINQSGDLDTIVGIPNVEQAIKVKFSTEKGELTVHPSFGARFPIGKKITTESFNTFQIQVQSTIYSDNRVESVESISFTNIGDLLAVTASLLLKNSSNLLTNFVLGDGAENF
jgi:hypothetical protein